MTAPATLLLAPIFGANLDGPIRWTEIWYDVKRPVRRLVTMRPLVTGPLVLDTVYARLSDYGDASAVQSLDSAEGASDIVVAGRGARRKGLKVVRVETDALSSCSLITFDKRARTITLTCRPPTASSGG